MNDSRQRDDSGEESESFSRDASRAASRMTKETIESELSKEIVEQAVEEGLVSASGTAIFIFRVLFEFKIDRLQLLEHYQEL